MHKTIAFLLCLALAGCDIGPSCEDRGGKEVLTGMVPFVSGAPPTQVITYIPIYECVGAADDTHNQHGEAADL